MKKIAILSMLLAAFGCADPDLQPIPFDKLETGSLLVLRGDAWNYLNNDSLLGEVDKFSIKATADDTFDFETEYVAKDKATLSKVEVYALLNGKGTRAKVTTIEGSKFQIPADPKNGRYPRAKISIPLSTILKALNITKANLVADESIIKIQSDLVLTTGKTVSATSIVNSSLYEAAWFYPAHSLGYLAVQ
jgi:hypothetical protein